MSLATYQSEVLARHLKAIKTAAGDEAMDDEERRLSDPRAFQEWWNARSHRTSFMDVTAATNERTLIAATCPLMPSGNKVPLLQPARGSDRELTLLLNSFVFDFVMRRRLSGLTVNYFIIEESPLPARSSQILRHLHDVAMSLAVSGHIFALSWLQDERLARTDPWRTVWSLSPAERLRRRCIADCLAAIAFDIDRSCLRTILSDCDAPAIGASNDTKGFWRVDKGKDPELRETVLTLVAFDDLERMIEIAGGNREQGIQAFLSQNGGGGWMLPDTLRLTDYGLGRDERANHPQPVASRLGPRFYDWQLAQTAQESWRECEIHAKNLEATGLRPSEASSPNGSVAESADTRVTRRDTRRRNEEKGLLGLYAQDDESE
jgi:hypothetical protein